jgi:hypothetical protein
MYKVNRPCLWFCKNDKLSKEHLEKYFNQEAIKQLIIDGFIEEIKIERVLPKSWEELGKVKGFYVDDDSEVCTALNFDFGYSTDLYNQNVFPTEAEAEACLSLSQLCQLRDAYNSEPLANWCDWNDTTQLKYCIYFNSNKISVGLWCNSHWVLSFKTSELRDEFLINFHDLIQQAKPLL